MSDIPPNTDAADETPPPSDSGEKLQPVGQKSMQGVAPESINPGGQLELAASDPALHAELNEWKRTHDPANWEYKLGGPHQDHQFSQDLLAAQRQNEIGRQAATADSLPDAINTTLAAHHDSKDQAQTAGDQYFHKKYGHQPYHGCVSNG